MFESRFNYGLNNNWNIRRRKTNDKTLTIVPKINDKQIGANI